MLGAEGLRGPSVAFVGRPGFLDPPGRPPAAPQAPRCWDAGIHASQNCTDDFRTLVLAASLVAAKILLKIFKVCIFAPQPQAPLT